MIMNIQSHFKKSAIIRMLSDHKFEKERINQIADYIYELKQKKYHWSIDILFFNRYLEIFDLELDKRILYDIYKYYE